MVFFITAACDAVPLMGVALPLPLLATAAATAGLHGLARVIDDGLEVTGQAVRLFGIGTPEADQVCAIEGRPWRCGEAAKTALQELIGGRELRVRA